MSKLFDFGLLQTMDLFKLWELIEFIPPEHLHSDEMLENPHFGVASNDEPVQIDLKCPNGRCIALDLPHESCSILMDLLNGNMTPTDLMKFG